MSDAPDAPVPAPVPEADDDVAVDLAAFLPEGTVLADVDVPDDLVAEPAEPGAEGAGEDDGIGGDVADGFAATDDDGPLAGPVHPVTDPVEPAVPSRPPLDVAVLARIEGELAAVDAALEAIDAGDPSRSALLVELLAEDPPAP